MYFCFLGIGAVSLLIGTIVLLYLLSTVLAMFGNEIVQKFGEKDRGIYPNFLDWTVGNITFIVLSILGFYLFFWIGKFISNLVY